jgi:hypothetical protein
MRPAISTLPVAMICSACVPRATIQTPSGMVTSWKLKVPPKTVTSEITPGVEPSASGKCCASVSRKMTRQFALLTAPDDEE